ncbi:hypothetical protein BD626DRAFT_573500 [Schizophyllum amplum]|uniref:HMG box domain-containing protein n=1 Tax=Schizophyllum amplum TaxID=97359 RepID=A0A550C114_9AGAR|nr:hypothetical protein BD626DRAFT_573500 [Auriculariopsis ampla]
MSRAPSPARPDEHDDPSDAHLQPPDVPRAPDPRGDARDAHRTEAEPNAALIAQTLNADGTPKRPMNAFMIFARRRRPQVSAANQSMRTGEISKILSKEWTQMPLSEKQFYLDQAKHLKDNFNSKYPEYVYRRKPNNSARRRRRTDAGGSPEAEEQEQAHGPADDDAGDTPPARAAAYPYPDTGVRRETEYFPERLSDFTLHRPSTHGQHGYMNGWTGSSSSRRPQSYSPSSSSHGSSWLTGSASPAPLPGDDPYSSFASFGGAYGGQGQSSTNTSNMSSASGVPAPSLFGLDGRGFSGGRAFLPPVQGEYGARGSDFAGRSSEFSGSRASEFNRASEFGGSSSTSSRASDFSRDLGSGRGGDYGRAEFSNSSTGRGGEYARSGEYASRASEYSSRASDLPALSGSRSTEFSRPTDFASRTSDFPSRASEFGTSSTAQSSNTRGDGSLFSGRVGLPPLPRLGGYPTGGSASPHTTSAPDLLWPKREQ